MAAERMYVLIEARGCRTQLAATIEEAIRRSYMNKWDVKAVFVLSLVALPVRSPKSPLTVLPGRAIQPGGVKR